MSGQVPWARSVGSPALLQAEPEAGGLDLVPAWARDLVGPARRLPGRDPGPAGVAPSARLAVGDEHALAEIRVPGAAALPAGRLTAVAEDAYRTIRSLAADCARPHPLRFWNRIPGINEPLAPSGHSRYMAFNSGRFAALTSWLGRPEAGCWVVPTATGVGSRDPELGVACLLGREPGLPVENPRQRPSYRYDPRYGPRPPCFSRATVARIGGERRLLVGGTASVRDQRSLHRGLLGRQFDETCRNLAALIGQASARPPGGLEQVVFEHLRAYVPRREHLGQVRLLLRSTARCRGEMEIRRMDLCRPELLVELEGMISLSGQGLA